MVLRIIECNDRLGRLGTFMLDSLINSSGLSILDSFSYFLQFFVSASVILSGVGISVEGCRPGRKNDRAARQW